MLIENENSEHVMNSSIYSEGQIKQFTNEVEFAQFDSEFARYFFEGNQPFNKEQLIDKIKPSLQDKRLVDLGCGINAMLFWNNPAQKYIPTMVELAQLCKASSYIGVDRSTDIWKYSLLLDPKYKDERKQFAGIDVDLVLDEMLHYVHSLPDHSSCFAINGIAPELIEGVGKPLRETNWFKALLIELKRATAKNGVILGVDSSIFRREDFEQQGFSPLNESYADPINRFVYIKQ